MLHFHQIILHVLERIFRKEYKNLITITDDKIRDEKLQHDINQEAAKISALSSKRIDKYEYLTGEEILLSNQRRVIKQTKFAYSPLGKAFEKQTKTIENKEEKQLKAIEDRGKQLVESNELIKNDSNIERDSIPFEELKKKKNLLKEDLLDFKI